MTGTDQIMRTIEELDIGQPSVDAEIHMSLERAKRESKIDNSFTSFRGKGTLTAAEAAKSLSFTQKSAQDKYV